MKLRLLALVCVALAVLISSSAMLFAQDANSGTTADGKYHLAMAKSHNVHANDHLKLLQKYAASHKTVPADVMKDHIDSINYHVQAAQKSYKKLATTSADQAKLLKQLDVIQQRLAKVSAMTKQLESQQAESAQIVAHTALISKELAANNAASEDVDNNFYNNDSSSYYTEGLGHFVD